MKKLTIIFCVLFVFAETISARSLLQKIQKMELEAYVALGSTNYKKEHVIDIRESTSNDLVESHNYNKESNSFSSRIGASALYPIEWGYFKLSSELLLFKSENISSKTRGAIMIPFVAGVRSRKSKINLYLESGLVPVVFTDKKDLEALIGFKAGTGANIRLTNHLELVIGLNGMVASEPFNKRPYIEDIDKATYKSTYTSLNISTIDCSAAIRLKF